MMKVCKKMMTAKTRHGALIVLTILASMGFLLSFNLLNASAQYLIYWSEQKKIPAYEIYNNEQSPYLIADKNHKVYAFNSQFIGDVDASDSQKAVFYREWTLANGWTYPNDVLADSDGSLELLNVSGDEAGKAHVIFQKNAQAVYYAQASLVDASNPENWSAPVQIGDNSLRITAGIANVAAIATDAEGKQLVVVYSGSQYGNGLYFTYSVDYGDTWSAPYPLYLTGDETMVVVSPSLYMGQSGFVHAVWSTFDSKGFGGPGYYARFDFDSGTWSEPLELDQPGIRHPSVIEYKTDVFISYHHLNTNSRWWRHSNDGGKTWTDPIQFSPRYVGTNGAVSFVVDSNNTLHAFFGGRTDDNGNHGMWQSIWLGSTWSLPSAVVMGQAITDIDGGSGFDPTFARAVVSNGNVILVTWGTDGGVGTNGAWYSYTVLDAPALPGIPPPTPLSIVENNLISKSELIATNPPTSTTTMLPDSLKKRDSAYINNPQAQIFVGVLVGALFIIVFIVRVFYIKKP